MKVFSKDEFQVFCLLYAFSLDVKLKKQNLVNFALCVDTEMFVRIYNIFENYDTNTREEILNKNKKIFFSSEYEADRYIEDFKNIFFNDETYNDIEKSVTGILRNKLSVTDQ